MERQLSFETFKKEDFKPYNQWFENDLIKQALYDVDQEWLDYVLNNNNGTDYSVFYDNELMAVIGISYPTPEEKFCGINNIAINPKYFRSGFGTAILNKLYKIHPLKVDEVWLTFVVQKNIAAQSFFEKNGWKFIRKEEENLLRYEFKNSEY